jgi:hypothetical protein
MSELSSGLVLAGHEVTVLCKKKIGDLAGVDVTVVGERSGLESLQQASRIMPESMQSARALLPYWHAFCEISDTRQFDVVETFQLLAATLITAIAAGNPVVLRMESSPANEEDGGFDETFKHLVERYVLACADAYVLAGGGCMDGVDGERICINKETDRSALALRQLEIYEGALVRHQRYSSPRLYRHGARRLIKSVEGMISLYDNMLYDLLFRVSYRFRLGHWWRKFCSDPQSFGVKLKSKVLSKPQ